ncbi:sentrin-specific protease 6-like [Aphis gossypii]|uniref:sentrin-specific protease 6-like n=1 Tax=Aphis gossypii TaxID=80765 RepID=UPI00215975A4|nr:sentrin-specific protease 6-like [Aphis gossypii]
MHDHNYHTSTCVIPESTKFLNTKILEDRLGGRSSAVNINDYKMLNSNEFINDILIEFYLNYWYTEKLSEEDRKRTYVFSTYFYTTLAKSFNAFDYPAHFTASQIRHEKVKKWTKNVDIFEKDFVFIPVNENQHWFMAVICFPNLSGKVNMKDGTPVNEPDDDAGRYVVPPIKSIAIGRNESDPNTEDLWPCILILDSLSGGVRRARITATLCDWLKQEYIAKYNGKIKDFSPQAIKGALIKLPQQPNYTDCGLFVIHFFKRFFERPIVDYTLPVRHLENWFSIDEVVKNCQKRRELSSIIISRMKNRGSILPDDIKLPFLDFTDPKNTRLSN